MVFLSELNENIETHLCVLRSRSTTRILKKLEFKISRNLNKKIKSGVYRSELCQTDLEEVGIHSLYVIKFKNGTCFFPSKVDFLIVKALIQLTN